MTDKTTTAGALFIKSMLPNDKTKEGFDIHRHLDKGGVSALINNLIVNGGDPAFDTISKLSKMFFNKATEIGATTPLTDYENDSDERKVIFDEFEGKLRGILENKNLSKQQQSQAIDTMAGDTRGVLNKQNLEYLLSRGSMAAKMAQSGARGNPSQLGIGTSSPLMAFDVKGNPIPIAIKHSFAEGLSPAEFFAMSYGGRASTVLTQLSTEKPGDLFKKLTPSVFHDVITKVDCGTKNGILISPDHKKAIIGRFEAGTNKFIDEKYYGEIRDRKEIKVRSAMTCEAHEGICQRCFGMSANGKLPEIGENMGVIAAQSVSEVLTQAMLSTKHQGGISGGQRNVYEEANNLLNNPKENFQDEATITKVNGKVTSITQTPLKDWHINVGETEHFVPKEQDPSVGIGDNVRTGDRLSSGTINPRKLTELKGMGAGRDYLANRLYEIYSKKASGLDKRHFEIIAKNMIKYGEVVNPGDSHFLPGQIMPINNMNKYLSENNKEVPIKDAVGTTLAKGILELTPGTHLTGNHVEDLHAKGIQTVHVNDSGFKINPLVPGFRTVKLSDDNWVSNLSFSKLIDVLKKASAYGQESPIHSTDPITPYVMGTEFGTGDHGKY